MSNIFINFTTAGLSKVVSDNLDSFETNKAELGLVSDVLKNVKTTKGEPIGFTSIPQFVGIDYVGYIIDKERLDKATNGWFRIDEYKIIGSSANSLKDTRLAFGNSYRYRIRSVVKNTIKTPNEDVFDYTSFYYEGRSSDWKYINVQDSKLPNTIEAIDISVDSYKKQMRLTWLQPLDTENLIISYKIYRREAIGQEWKTISDSSKSNNLFIDNDVDYGRKYIYAFSTKNRHEIESLLSVQIQAELNGAIKIEKKEKPLIFISGPGLRPDEIHDVIKRPFNKVDYIIARKNIAVSPAEALDEDEKILLIKIKSLDTHETQELRLVLKNVNIGNELKEIE